MTATDTPLDTSQEFRRRARFVVSLVALAVVVLATAWMVRQALLLVFLGVALGVLFYRLSQRLAGWTGVGRGWALAGVLLGTLGLIVGVGTLGLPRILAEGRVLLDEAPAVLETVRARLGLPPSLFESMSGTPEMAGRLLGAFSSVLGAVASLLVVVLVAVYVAASPRTYADAVARLVDRENQPFVRKLLHESADVLMGWLKGVGVAVVLLGAMAVVGLSVIGVPGAIALGVFAGLLTAIPNVGPFIGWAPAILVAFSQGTTPGLWTLGLAVVAQQIEGSFITPKIQGAMVSVGPVFILAGQVVLAALTGFLGVLLVVPVLGVGAVLVRHLYIGPFVEGEPAEPDAHDGDPEPDGAPEPDGESASAETA